EAEEDMERIMKDIIPKDQGVHIHCFTDTTALGLHLFKHFPNPHLSMTSVICYTMNLNTTKLFKQILADNNKCILLETGAPYM
ncbi:hypothetical protein F5146DRAFT_874129, partial [Armillaria mellea]